MENILAPQASQIAEFSFLTQLALFLPKIVIAVMVLVFGILIAKALKALVVRLIGALNLSQAVDNTPVEHFLKNADLAGRLDDIVGSIIYWLFMLVVMDTAAAALGLTSLVNLIEQILSYIPNIIAAMVVLIIGVLLAGVIESLVKGSFSTVDTKTARLLGKFSGYMVVTLTVLIALSELGIAREFIIIAFVGLIGVVTIAFGLSLGLGGQHLVKKLLADWYQRVSSSPQVPSTKSSIKTAANPSTGGYSSTSRKKSK